MQLAQRPVAGNAVRASRASRQRVVMVKAAKTSSGPRIAIVGVTGAVGQEFLTVSGRRQQRRHGPGARRRRMPHGADGSLRAQGEP